MSNLGIFVTGSLFCHIVIIRLCSLFPLKFDLLKGNAHLFRAPVQAEEPLSNGKHLNRPPNSAAQNIKERTNAMASDMRSSKALPHAKFIL